jgi:tetratricopeptide (TPR) repeat protein/glycosyltransferase involved in cell wall biosynthesis
MTARWKGVLGWLVPPPRGGTAVPVSPGPDSRTADSLRDAQRWNEAAKAYEALLLASPTARGLWVQLGNMRKESGDLTGAEKAYGEALRLHADDDDTYLQLGHALKLQGRNADAVAAYVKALRINPASRPALEELIGFGEGAVAERETGIGARGLADLHAAVFEIKRTLGRLEAALPDIASLTSLPVRNYALFARTHRIPPPPNDPGDVTWSVVACVDPSGASVAARLQDLSMQQHLPIQVCFVPPSEDVDRTVKQYANGGLRCPVETADTMPLATLGGEWCLLLQPGLRLNPLALAWLSWAVRNVDADAIMCDEDLLATATDTEPSAVELKCAYDPEPECAPFVHGLLAVRTAVLQRRERAQNVGEDLIAALSDQTGRAGRLAHLARVLATRTQQLPVPRRLAAAADAPVPGLLRLVIPARNSLLLKACVDAVYGTVSAADSIELVILDNGSDQPEAMEYLRSLEVDRRATVRRMPQPFNWSALSNEGARGGAAPYLLFLNDDVEIATPGWDIALRRLLGRDDVGAVGTRLVYPDGTLQHAGMVFGPDGRAEHEGVGMAGLVSPSIAARWHSRRRVAAVTGAFLACRRSVFEQAGGFDAGALPIWFNDVDFCLRVRRLGKQIIYEPAISAVHHESKTLRATSDRPDRRRIWEDSLELMRQRWGAALATDPSFNPAYGRTGRPFASLHEPSVLAIRAHLQRSALPNPWSV